MPKLKNEEALPENEIVEIEPNITLDEFLTLNQPLSRAEMYYYKGHYGTLPATTKAEWVAITKLNK